MTKVVERPPGFFPGIQIAFSDNFFCQEQLELTYDFSNI